MVWNKSKPLSHCHTIIIPLIIDDGPTLAIELYGGIVAVTRHKNTVSK